MPLSCSLAEFLCGATEPSLWLHQHFDDYIADIDRSFEPEAVETVLDQPSYGLVCSNDGCNALLIHRVDVHRSWSTHDAVVGYYNPPGAVCIQDAHQGHRLGAEIILWTALNLSGGAPTASLDEQCFTAAGFAAHQAAWRLGVQRGAIVDSLLPTPSPARRPRP